MLLQLCSVTHVQPACQTHLYTQDLVQLSMLSTTTTRLTLCTHCKIHQPPRVWPRAMAQMCSDDSLTSKRVRQGE
jgi:hypothetical protein